MEQQIGSGLGSIGSPAQYEIYGRTPEQARSRRKRTLWRDRRWFRRVETAPTADPPVTVDQVRDRLRLGSGEPDADITLMIRAAMDWWEGETETLLLPQTWQMVWDWFPEDGAMIPLFLTPVRSVTSVQYLDKDSEEQTLAAAGWTSLHDSYGSAALARLGTNRNWPDREFKQYRPDGVRITAEVGYATASTIPADVIDALILWVGMRYRFREAVTEQDVRVLPWGLRSVVNRYCADLGQRTMTLGM